MHLLCTECNNTDVVLLYVYMDKQTLRCSFKPLQFCLKADWMWN